MGDYELKKEQLKTCLAQCEYLISQQALMNDSKYQVNDIHRRFDNITMNVDKVRDRNSYLERIIKISSKVDDIASKIRNLSTQSARRFMAEEDDASLQTAVNDQKTILDQMKQLESQMETHKLEAKEINAQSLARQSTRIPLYIEEKINSIQELIRQSLNEELDRRASLLEVKQASDQKQIKFNELNKNVDFIKKILANKNSELPCSPTKNRKYSFIKSNENSLIYFNNSCSLNLDEFYNENEGDNFENRSNIKQKQYAKYLNKLAKCKELINESKFAISELKYPIANLSIVGGSARTPTPSHHEFNELRDFEFKLDAYERDIDDQIDIFEQNLAKQAKIDKNLDEINTKLTDLMSRFEKHHLPSFNIEQLEQLEINQPIEALEQDYNKAKVDLEQIALLHNELDSLDNEKCELLREDNRNLSKSRIGSLLEGFNETIFELDLEKDNEVTNKLNQFKQDLEKVEEKCSIKLNELKFKIEQHSISKKQRKLNMLRETLDLQLDTLVNLKLDRNEEEDNVDEEEEEDLLKESDKILLDNVALDESNISFNLNKSMDIGFIEGSDKKSHRSNESHLRSSRSVEKFERSRIIEPISRSRSRDSRGSVRFEVDCNEESEKKSLKYANENETESSESESVELDNEDKYFNIKLVHETSRYLIHDEELLDKSRIVQPVICVDDEKKSSSIDLDKSQIEMDAQYNIRIHDNDSITQRKSRLDEKGCARSSLKSKSRSRSRSKGSVRFEIEENSDKQDINTKKILETSTRLIQEDERKFLEESNKETFNDKDERVENITVDYIINANGETVIEENQEIIEEYDMDEANTHTDNARMQSEDDDDCKTQSELEEDLIESERQKLEMEIIEREIQERERVDKIERDIAERAHRAEAERLEKLERIRIENEKLRVEREQAEFERAERQRLEEERVRVEIESLERERLERQRIEWENAELERKRNELERKKRLLEKAEFEKIERERMEHERIRKEKELAEREREKEETERREHERVQRIERDRVKRLEIEQIELERMRAEKEETERKEQQIRREKEIEEEEIKRQHLHKLKQAELDEMEKEKRRKKLQEFEKERAKHEKKLKLEYKLKEICESFNSLKERINQLNSIEHVYGVTNEETVHSFINDYEAELRRLNSEIETMSFENYKESANEFGIFNGLDQATQTQFDLIKSFSTYLNAQLELKKSDFHKRKQIHAKLAEYEQNLAKFIELALKFNSQTDKGSEDQASTKATYVEDLNDLENRIDSIQSIEDSIQNCLEKIGELRDASASISSSEHEIEPNFANYRDKFEIESRVLQPLSSHRADLKHFLIQWNLFNEEFDAFITYLKTDRQMSELNYRHDSLEDSIGKDERFIEDVYGNEKYAQAELQKFASIREKFVNKLNEVDNLFIKGASLFDPSYGQRVLAPNATKEFNEIREFIKGVDKFLEEKCAVLKFVCKQQEKMRCLESDLSAVNFELDEMYTENLSDPGFNKSDLISLLKFKLEKLAELKKRVKMVVHENENAISLFKEISQIEDLSHVSHVSLSKLEAISAKYTGALRKSLDKTANETIRNINELEVNIFYLNFIGFYFFGNA